MTRPFLRAILVALFVDPGLAEEAKPLVLNGGFEQGLEGWSGLWSREKDAGQAALDPASAHAGKQSLHIEHRGTKDWSLPVQHQFPVKPGEIYELDGWIRREGAGSVVLSAITRDEKGGTVRWSHGEARTAAGGGWKEARARFVVPDGVATIQPRWMGDGPTSAWVDDLSLRRAGSIEELRQGPLPPETKRSNKSIDLTVRADGTFVVRDLRNGKTWEQRNPDPQCVVTGIGPDAGGGLRLELLQVEAARPLAAVIRLDGQKPEFTVAVSGEMEMAAPLRFPAPFRTSSGTRLVVPLNEGFSFPVEDAAVPEMRLVAYGGHGICMAFWGVTDGPAAQMAILETPDDASIDIRRHGGLFAVAPLWDGQKGRLGYERGIRYVFFDQGGHVAVAKRYREHAKNIGLFKTLARKREENPNTDLLLGAVNVWSWEKEAVGIVKEMQAAGLNRILWSGGGSAETVRALNDLPGVLTSRYDIYQDVMDPANFPALGHTHGDWVTAAWPRDIVRDAQGDWLRGWAVRGPGDQWFSCGVICDKQALPHARHRMTDDLAARPFKCRFIDTTTAAPWHECYDPAHPMTRSESREWKMKLLDLVSKDFHQVTGCETGHDASVPFLHYFEGMMSLGPFRIPDAGRDMARIWTEVPDNVARFQLGHRYRLPLWELVYHDCVVAQWYWGDYNNKLPALWDKRDLFNTLYATPPMFMFNRGLWNQEKDRFVRSFRASADVIRAAATSEMTDHRFLDPERDVQQTVFSNGLTVTVNFGDKPFRLPDGSDLAPTQAVVKGLPK